MAGQLVSLPEVERLSPACIRVLGGNPSKFTLQGTNTYILGKGPSRLLIDTGEGKPSWIAALKRTLQEEQISLHSALITHWHHDHVGGIKDLLKYSPDTKIYKHQAAQGQIEIQDGQKFSVDGATLKAVHTPGHTVDHMVFVFEEEDALFTGDNVLGQGTAVYEDLGTYLESLGQMENLVQGRAYPGHGPVIAEAKPKISEYIAHRRQREQQVLQTLALPKLPQTASDAAIFSEAWTPMELVKIIYRDVPENLHLPAQGGVIQILHKLKAEDRVTQDEADLWRLKDRSSL